jgi:hypothetical protein
MWHWHVITRRRLSQITRHWQLSTTTISLFIIHSDATDVNAGVRKKSSAHKNKKAVPCDTASEVCTIDLR